LLAPPGKLATCASAILPFEGGQLLDLSGTGRAKPL
jgi:hypothetical protein